MKMLRSAFIAFVGLALLAGAGCATASGGSGQGPQDQVVEIEEYRLSSGDQIRITVFGEPALSGDFAIDGQGVISMSLIGEINANNLTVRELQRTIETRLRDGFVREPRVSAEITNFRPFYILGEINRPGQYPYVAGLTVMRAIASAGDFTYRADRKRIMIKSNDEAEERSVELSPTTPVRPGDTIRIRERFF